MRLCILLAFGVLALLFVGTAFAQQEEELEEEVDDGEDEYFEDADAGGDDESESESGGRWARASYSSSQLSAIRASLKLS